MNYCFFRLVRYLSCTFEDERIFKRKKKKTECKKYYNLSRLLNTYVLTQDSGETFG